MSTKAKQFNTTVSHNGQQYNITYGGAAEYLRQMTAIKNGTYVAGKDYTDPNSGPIRGPSTPPVVKPPTAPTPTPTPQQPPPVQQPSVPSYTPPSYTPPQYKQMSYEDARKQAAGQLDPTYQQALQEIQRQRFANEQQAGSLAAARGLGRSGLSADLQNKVNLSAMQQGSGLAAQRASQEAAMATALVDQDFNRQQAIRDLAFREYMGQNQVSLNLQQLQMQQQQMKQQQDQYSRDYILRQLQAMANAGIDISKAQESWLLRPWG